MIALLGFMVGLPMSAGSPARHALPVRASVRAEACPCFKILYQFGPRPDGSVPQAPLTYLNGLLYGTTTSGGPQGHGTFFSIAPSGQETVLHEFGTMSGDGGAPQLGAPINVDGMLYGTTSEGGSHGDGTIYSITPSGTETVVYSFDGAHGNAPYGGLIDVGGVLYGTTSKGGANQDGTVFGVTLGGKETMLYSFAGGTDAAEPNSTLIDVDGVLYGTSSLGGKFSTNTFRGYGTVFKVTTAGAEKVTYSFAGSNGRLPFAGLVELSGVLYGTTTYGGANLAGTVFGITPQGATKMSYSFGSGGVAGGGFPLLGALTVLNGVLYGTTSGGSHGHSADYPGVVYGITPAGAESAVHTFAENGASDPIGGLTVVNGVLYGTTSDGPNDGGGTVYSLNL